MATRRQFLATAAGGAVGSGLVGVSAATAAIEGAETPLILTAADRRPGLDLSGVWNWSIDPYRDGAAGFHGAPPDYRSRRTDDPDTYAEVQAHPERHYEFDLRRAPTATLPEAWLAHAPELRHYVGLMWYRRAFVAPPIAGQRSILRFGAANYRTHVYLNGVAVGGHEGGFTPFALDVTAALKPGENSLVVAVDNQHGAASIPPLVTDWENYGGITRPVSLLQVPDTFVDDVWVRLRPDGRIAADVSLRGPAAAGSPVRVRIPELGWTLQGVTGPDGTWRGGARAPRGLVRWSPERPTLYDVRIEAGEDVLVDRIGFRIIERRGPDILLNGRPIFLRGICLHEEEIGPNPARRMTRDAARALLTEVKNGLNGNFVRLAHYPHADEMVRAADEIGLLVWSEIPVYWRVAFADPQALSTARRMLAENIRRDRNRASIAIWSVANETPESDARNAFLRTLIGDVRTLDDSRLVSAAILVARATADGRAVLTLQDPLADDLDVLGVNTYTGWYSHDPLESLPATIWRVPMDKPLFFSEFGAGAKAGHRDPATKLKFSEDFQAEYYKQTLAMSETIPSLRGLTPWILKDFRSPRRQHPLQQGWNRKGVIDPEGRRKAAFAVLADHYRTLAARWRDKG